MNTYYLRVEAVNLGHFVYDTKDLSTIRGGGLLLLNAVEHLAAYMGAVKLTPLMTAASAGIYQFEADDEKQADSVRRDVDGQLAAHPQLQHATFVVDVQSARTETDFNADHEMLIARNRWRQMQSPSVAVPAQNDDSAIEACKIDGVRPGRATIWGPENKVVPVSSSVAVRCDYGREQKKQDFYREQAGKEEVGLFTRDFDDLTGDPAQGNLHHKMAVIYLDGNGFGAKKKGNGGELARQRKFDDTVKAYRRKFLNALLDRIEKGEHWRTSDKEPSNRLETLLWGGDEIIWVVPAWKGWETLGFFYEESKAWEFEKEPLYHAGGMVLCHHNAPIHRITELAKRLADLAKNKDRQQSLFAYEVLESFDHIGRNLDAYRTERSPHALDPSAKIDSNVLILAGDGMSDVLAEAVALKQKLTRRKLHAMVDELLTRVESPEEITGRQRLRKELAEELNASLDDQASRNALAALTPKLNGEWARWLHLCALWDYLV